MAPYFPLKDDYRNDASRADVGMVQTPRRLGKVEWSGHCSTSSQPAVAISSQDMIALSFTIICRIPHRFAHRDRNRFNSSETNVWHNCTITVWPCDETSPRKYSPRINPQINFRIYIMSSGVLSKNMLIALERGMTSECLRKPFPNNTLKFGGEIHPQRSQA
jgi:hypothetical protein